MLFRFLPTKLTYFFQIPLPHVRPTVQSRTQFYNLFNFSEKNENFSGQSSVPRNSGNSKRRGALELALFDVITAAPPVRRNKSIGEDVQEVVLSVRKKTTEKTRGEKKTEKEEDGVGKLSVGKLCSDSDMVENVGTPDPDDGFVTDDVIYTRLFNLVREKNAVSVDVLAKDTVFDEKTLHERGKKRANGVSKQLPGWFKPEFFLDIGCSDGAYFFHCQTLLFCEEKYRSRFLFFF